MAKTFSALTALEWFLLRMDVTVITKVVLPPKRLAAKVTRVRPLVRVGAFVNEEVVRLGKLSGAKLANELLLRPRSGSA